MTTNIKATPQYLGYLEGLLERDLAWARRWYARAWLWLGLRGPGDTGKVQCPSCFHRRPRAFGPPYDEPFHKDVVTCMVCDSKGFIRDIVVCSDGVIAEIEKL